MRDERVDVARLCGDVWIVSEMKGVLLRFPFHSKYDCADLELYAVKVCVRVRMQVNAGAMKVHCDGHF